MLLFPGTGGFGEGDLVLFLAGAFLLNSAGFRYQPEQQFVFEQLMLLYFNAKKAPSGAAALNVALLWAWAVLHCSWDGA